MLVARSPEEMNLENIRLQGVRMRRRIQMAEKLFCNKNKLMTTTGFKCSKNLF